MLSSLIAGLALLQVQEPVKDYKLPIMSVHEFGEWLGAQNGERVIVSPDVGERNVYINVKEKTISDVLEMVEKAVGIRVLRENGAVTILPGKVLSGADIFKFFENNVNLIGEANVTEAQIDQAVKDLVEGTKKLRGTPRNSEEWVRLAKLRRLDPSRSLLATVIRSIGVGELQNIPDKSRIVYSTIPTRLQRPWPVQSSTQIEWFNRLCTARNAAVLTYIPTTTDEEGGLRSDGVGMFSVFGGREDPVKAMQLVVQPDLPFVSFELRYYNADGMLIHSEFEYLQAAEKENEDELYDYENQERYSKLEGELKLSESEQLELKRATQLYGSSSESGEFLIEDVQYMSTIDSHHPLSGVVSKIYDYACEVSGNQLVTEVFDAGYWESEFESISAQDAALICFGYGEEHFNQVVVTEQGVYSQTMRDFAPPRKSLALLARSILAKGGLDLDVLADGVAQLPNRDMVSSFVSTALSMCGQDDYSEMYESEGDELFGLEIYARLNGQQREAVKSPNGLLIDSTRMNQSVRWLFDDQIRKTEFIVGYSWEHYSDDEDMEEYERMSLLAQSWQGEQTVFLADPKNYPPQVHLKMGKEEAVTMKVTSEDSNYVYTASLEEMGMYQYYAEEAKRLGEVSQEKTLYAVGSKISLVSDLRFGAMPTRSGSFRMTGRPPEKFGEYDQLPAAIRQQIHQHFENYKKEFGEPPNGGGNGNLRK